MLAESVYPIKITLAVSECKGVASGIVESYVLGLASDAERQEFENTCA